MFENTIAWLRENYGSFRFFTERDIVWTVHLHICKLIEDQNLPYRVFHNFPILPGKRRAICADLAILDQNNSVEVAVEFKYEPSHRRKGRDIWHSHIEPSVVFWGKEGVGKDVERIHEFVDKGRAKVAYLIFVDEGGYFRWRDPHPGSKWIDWQVRSAWTNRVSILRAQAPQ